MGTLGIDTTSGMGHRIKVFIVDSSLVAGYRLGHSLEKDRFEVTLQATLDEGAIAEIAEMRPDVVVMDAEFVQALESPALQNVLPDTPILLLENGTGPKVRQVGMEKLQSKEVNGFLSKDSPYACVAHSILALFHGASVVAPEFHAAS
jgi:DNA-binding NarL/FixJ family response regulator